MRRWISPALIAVAALVSLAAYSRLPDSVPIHWSIDGTPDGWAPRWIGAFLLPAFALLLWIVLEWLPRIDPRSANLAKFRGSYELVVTLAIATLAMLHVAMLGSALGWPVRIPSLATTLLGVVFLVLGNVLPRARSNFIFGIRTPWTLSSERVWTRTHRLAGYLLVGGGLACIAAAFLPPRPAFVVAMGALGATGLVSVVASYLFWRGEQRGA